MSKRSPKAPARKRITWNTWRAEFEQALRAAATRAGVDLMDLDISPVLLSEGTVMGLGFRHPDSAVSHRAAVFFQTWGLRHMPPLFDDARRQAWGAISRLDEKHLDNPGAHVVPYLKLRT